MNAEGVIGTIRAMNARMQAEKELLTELDNAIADGDHGINMARGFAAVEAKLPELAGMDIAAVLGAIGRTIVSAVGGSAGPLYGTMFMKAGLVAAGKDDFSIDDLVRALAAAIEGVERLGRARRGDKTMLDAMIPALEAMTAKRERGGDAADTLAAGIEAAREGAEYTKTIAAARGRASYIGERSIGHRDPGAVSFTFLLECIEA